MIHNDHLGTPQKMTDASGTVVWSADYKPFGEATITVSTITNNLRFPGQYYDAETGIHYNYKRDYNPMIGRYFESDPIGLEGGMNTYVYVANNPLSNDDPYGLDYWVEGAVEGEAGWGFHQSVCVGKWDGKRKCISFGRMKGEGNCLFDCKGHVYYDKSAAGPIVADKYSYTDSATDAKISSYFDSQAGSKGRWDVIGAKNCRAYSQQVYDYVASTYGGKSGPPPTPNLKKPGPPSPGKK